MVPEEIRLKNYLLKERKLPGKNDIKLKWVNYTGEMCARGLGYQRRAFQEYDM